MIFICDDNALMEQVKCGNKEAFDELVLLHRKSAIGFAYRFAIIRNRCIDYFRKNSRIISANYEAMKLK